MSVQHEWIEKNGDNWDHPRALKHGDMWASVVRTLSTIQPESWPANPFGWRVLLVEGFMVRKLSSAARMTATGADRLGRCLIACYRPSGTHGWWLPCTRQF